MEDKRVIMLKKRSKSFKEQCESYEDFIRIDVTSCSRNEKMVKDLSPFYIGPVVSSDGIIASTFETYDNLGKYIH